MSGMSDIGDYIRRHSPSVPVSEIFYTHRCESPAKKSTNQVRRVYHRSFQNTPAPQNAAIGEKNRQVCPNQSVVKIAWDFPWRSNTLRSTYKIARCVSGLRTHPQIRFQKCPFSYRRKRSKIFSSIRIYSFHISTLKLLKNMKTTGTWNCACFLKDHKTIHHLGLMLRFGLEWMACDAFYVTVFKSLRFLLSTLETMRFQKSPLNFQTVFIGVFVRFTVWKIDENASKSMRFQTKTY